MGAIERFPLSNSLVRHYGSISPRHVLLSIAPPIIIMDHLILYIKPNGYIFGFLSLLLGFSFSRKTVYIIPNASGFPKILPLLNHYFIVAIVSLKMYTYLSRIYT